MRDYTNSDTLGRTKLRSQSESIGSSKSIYYDFTMFIRLFFEGSERKVHISSAIWPMNSIYDFQCRVTYWTLVEMLWVVLWQKKENKLSWVHSSLHSNDKFSEMEPWNECAHPWMSSAHHFHGLHALCVTIFSPFCFPLSLSLFLLQCHTCWPPNMLMCSSIGLPDQAQPPIAICNLLDQHPQMLAEKWG
jgi:hypothetical protein